MHRVAFRSTWKGEDHVYPILKKRKEGLREGESLALGHTAHSPSWEACL